MFVSKERVIRDGYLIAYDGEEMSDDEAKARGLIKEEKPKAKRSARRKKTPEADAPEADDGGEQDGEEEQEQ